MHLDLILRGYSHHLQKRILNYIWLGIPTLKMSRRENELQIFGLLVKYAQYPTNTPPIRLDLFSPSLILILAPQQHSPVLFHISSLTGILGFHCMSKHAFALETSPSQLNVHTTGFWGGWGLGAPQLRPL
jgi:hypothetical protein